MRLQSTDVALTIVTSWTKINPDTGLAFENSISPSEKLSRMLRGVSHLLNPRLKVINMVARNDQAFHDRYLLLYPHEGPTKIFLLSNSVNKMAGRWPFCMTLLSDDIKHEVQNYIEGLCRGQDVTGSTNPSVTFSWPPQP